jgi:hypothetical protein
MGFRITDGMPKCITTEMVDKIERGIMMGRTHTMIARELGLKYHQVSAAVFYMQNHPKKEVWPENCFVGQDVDEITLAREPAGRGRQQQPPAIRTYGGVAKYG